MHLTSRKTIELAFVVMSTTILGGCFELGDPVNTNPNTLSGGGPNEPPAATVNSTPVISGSPSTVASVGTNWSFTPTATDADGDTLSFTISNQPNWTSFNSSTGLLSGTPQLGQEGNYSNIQITVSDGTSTANLPRFSIAVSNNNSNNAPTISGVASTSIDVGQMYSFVPSAADADGDILSFLIANAPNWTNFDSATGQLSGTPQAGDTGLHENIVISASDGQESASLPAFSIDVRALPVANRPPQISGTAAPIATVDQPYSFRPTASDPDGDVLSFTVSNQPSWATFNAGTGELTGTPLSTDVAVNADIVITVSDGVLSASLDPFSITVSAIPNENDAPTISGIAPSTAAINEPYTFRPAASDPDGDVLSFSISSQPAWALFDSGTGELAGTPQSGDEGVFANIVITVSDGEFSASLAPFSITVDDPNPNQAPTISGVAPSDATVNQSYSFLPSAADPDGDTLSFSISNQPAWATFDTSTGQLAGTPEPGDEAVYPNIVVNVSDGNLSASLSPFTITVSQTATGSVTLTWTAPTHNTDGSALTDLAGYKFYYGTSSGTYPNEVLVENPGLTTVVIDNLPANTYYFVSTSINEANIESAYSNEATKIVN